MDIGGQITRIVYSIANMLAGKNGELIYGGINLAEVIDAGGRLGASPGP